MSESAGDAAHDAAAAARRAGATGRGDHGALSAHQRALRDTAIVAQLHAGEKVKDVAQEWELTSRQVRRVWNGFNARRTALEAAPMEIVERLLRSYEQQLVDYARMAVANAERMPAVAIAAMRGRDQALERYATLLAEVGKLPDNMELFRTQSEYQRVGEAMLAKLQELVAGDVTAGEVLEFFVGLFDPGPTVEGSAVELPPGS